MKANKIILILLLVMIVAGILQSCGVRKSQVEINKQSEKVDEGSKDKGEEKKESESKSESKEEIKADKSEEITTTKVEEEIDSNGKVNKRTTTTSTEKRKDNSSSNKSTSNQSKSFEYKSWVKTYWKVVTIKTKEKSKETKTDNTGWIVGLVFLGGIALLFLFLYAKIRRKLSNATSMI